MAKKINDEWRIGTRCKVAGRSQPVVVSYALAVPMPNVIKGEFVLVDTVLLKFITATESFYAWAADCTKLEGKK